MHYRRMPIETESPEELGYENIECNLAESSFADQRLSDLGISLNDVVLFYGDHKGKPALRELIASEINSKPGHVLITPGAAPALFIIASSLLGKGDHVVVVKTNYATNIETPRAIGARLSLLNLQFEKGYNIDMNELEKLITPGTKLVSLTYPHNPTGVMIDKPTLKKIVDLVEQKNTYLLIDETYRDMCFVDSLPVAATLSDRVISVSSMSKSYGLPGIRMGWIITMNSTLMETFLAAKEQIFITNSVIDEEIAYHYLLNRERLLPQVKDTIKKNFEIMRKFMIEQAYLEWIEPQGGCVCFPRIKKEIQVDINKFYDLLINKYKTYVGRGRWFEEDDRYMRIGYGWEKSENLERGLDSILKSIKESIR